MIYKIEPCPWCGNKVPDIGYEPPEDGLDERWYIICEDCNMTTFRCKALWKAIENWNTLTRVMHIDLDKGYIPVHERRKVTCMKDLRSEIDEWLEVCEDDKS